MTRVVWGVALVGDDDKWLTPNYSGATPAEALAALRKGIEKQRDEAVAHAQSQVEAASLVLAHEVFTHD